MTTIEELKEIAYKIGDFAYIAGGFYKDLVNKKEPKDIDVFMYSTNGYYEVVKILEKIEKCKKISNRTTDSVGRFEIIKPLRIKGRDLFGEPEELVETFDIDITRVWVDKNGLHVIGSLDEINWEIENMLFIPTLFKEDEQRCVDRMNRYKGYGYTPIKIEKRNMIKRTKCNMTGGY